MGAAAVPQMKKRRPGLELGRRGHVAWAKFVSAQVSLASLTTLAEAPVGRPRTYQERLPGPNRRSLVKKGAPLSVTRRTIVNPVLSPEERNISTKAEMAHATQNSLGSRCGFDSIAAAFICGRRRRRSRPYEMGGCRVCDDSGTALRELLRLPVLVPRISAELRTAVSAVPESTLSGGHYSLLSSSSHQQRLPAQDRAATRRLVRGVV